MAGSQLPEAGKDQPPSGGSGQAPIGWEDVCGRWARDIRPGTGFARVAGPVDGTFEIRAVPDVGYGLRVGASR